MREYPAPPPSPSIDGDGVRVFATRPARSRAGWIAVGLAAAALAAAAWWLATRTAASTPAARGSAGAQVDAHPAIEPVPAGPRADRRAPGRSVARAPTPAMHDSVDWPSGDPRDLASHFRPGDPEPGAGEVIRALQESGDHTGLGAFNPPGTSPPLHGLAVPGDFVLPPGYVRHHQVTDDGVALEPILMFAPDFAAVDATGIALDRPQDRVVPPELAPPGLPLRAIEIPDP
jgi:hypothetical protein